MKASYKIALALAATMAVLILVYYANQDDGVPAEPGADVATSGQNHDAPAPRATLRSSPSPTTTTPPAPRTTAAAPTSPQTPATASPDASSPSDLMARIRRQYAATQTQQAPAEPSETDADPGDTTNTEPAAATASTPATTLAQSDPSPTPEGMRSPSATAPSTTAIAKENLATPPAPPPAQPVIQTAPRPTPAPPAASTGADTYTVVAGDNLSKIATKIYGDDRHWVDIAQANPLIDPTKLKIGQQLRLPSADQLDQASPNDHLSAPGDTVIYTIRAGDTLSTIAEMHYANPTQWRVIYNANRDKIGPNPDRIKAGMKLTIPPALPEAE